jgi:uncharacterized protein (UPF0216 family)
MNKKVLDFKSYLENVSESVIQKYSMDQISDALDSIESDIAEYYGVSGDPNLTFDKNGEEVTISPDISNDVSDYSYDYDKSLARDVIRNLSDEDDGKKPRFTKDVIERVINDMAANGDFYITDIDTSGLSVYLDVSKPYDDRITVDGQIEDSSVVEVTGFDFAQLKDDIMEELTRSIINKIDFK